MKVKFNYQAPHHVIYKICLNYFPDERKKKRKKKKPIPPKLELPQRTNQTTFGSLPNCLLI